MTKTLVIARHAKSDWALGLPDHQRPLNSRGKRNAPSMGKALHSFGFEPDLIMSSTAVRAKTTATAVAMELDYHLPIKLKQEIYEEDHIGLTNLIQGIDDSIERAIIFGHNPTLEQLAGHLLQMEGSIMIPTCGMVCLETQVRSWADIKPGNFHLKWFLIPKLLA